MKDIGSQTTYITPMPEISAQVIATLEASVEDFLAVLLREQEQDNYEPSLRVLIWEIVARKAHTYAARYA